jgi:hypothetical protein
MLKSSFQEVYTMGTGRRNSLILFVLMVAGFYWGCGKDDVIQSPVSPPVIVTPPPATPVPTPPPPTLIACSALAEVELAVSILNDTKADATPITTDREYCMKVFPTQPLYWRRCPYGQPGSVQRTSCEKAQGRVVWLLNSDDCLLAGTCWNDQANPMAIKIPSSITEGRIEFCYLEELQAGNACRATKDFKR